MRFIVVSSVLAGCAIAPAPPHAVVTAAAGARVRTGTILVLPSMQDEVGASRCLDIEDEATTRFVAPMLLLKLQLAGYTIVDATTLKLASAEREEVTHDGGTWAVRTDENVSTVSTVADLSWQQQERFVRATGLTGVLRTRVTAVYDSQCEVPDRVDIRAELVEDERSMWTVTCTDSYFDWDMTLKLLGTCVGDAVLAWHQ